MPTTSRHKRLGVDGQLFKMAVENLKWARRDGAHDAATAERLDLSVSELQLFCRGLIKPGRLTADEVELFRRVASVRRYSKSDAAASGPGSGRRDVVAERSNDVVYVTTSGRAGVFHLRLDCPLLHRGQAAAATMGKEVWAVERIPQPGAERDGRDPCTFCVPSLGSAELLGAGSRTAPSQRNAPRGRRGGEPTHTPSPESKRDAKLHRDLAEANRLGISIPELKARRRAESEKASRRRRIG